MKINDAWLKILDSTQPATQKKTGDTAFTRTLAGLKENADSSETARVASVSTEPLLGSSPVGEMLASANAGRSRVARTLSLLEEYSQALADPAKSLKDMDALVGALELEAEQLAQFSRDLPDGHELKPLSNRTAVLAAVEAAKFNRGDYI